jgi:hypothetical protein
MKGHLKNAGEILLGIAAAGAGVGLVTLALKICWTVVELTWGLW